MTQEIHPPKDTAPTWVRYRVLGFLCLMAFILYLDRICISQAVSKIQGDLKISNTAMGFILAAFTLAYGLFEVPTGHWGDRYGSRSVLTRIVWWWSAFTILTGLAMGFWMLLIVRFLFGAGEAGALPNTARVIQRWFPSNARGPAQGIVITCALLGGALSPLVAEGLILGLGWRGTFIVLGIPGILWGIWFYGWFRDDPAEHTATNAAERHYISGGSAVTTTAAAHPPIPWKIVLTTANIWVLGTLITCCAFTTYFFFSWYPTYLQKGRSLPSGFASELASLVLMGGALGSLSGGYLIDWLVRRTGTRRWSRKTLGALALASAALAMALSIQMESPWLSAGCAAWACFAVHLQLPTWWGVVTDISGPHLGALFGLLNSMGVPGAVGSQLFLGGFVDYLQGLGFVGRESWDPAFYIYAGLLAVGAVLWLFANPTKPVIPVKTGETEGGH